MARGNEFTFDLSKCDSIFDELPEHRYIKLLHPLLPLDELKHRAYYKFIIMLLMLLMIAILIVSTSNWLLMRNNQV